MKAVDERITCLVTDAGKEWQGMPQLTEEYGFVWKRKNVTLTGHGAMARLDRTVRTLRWYMFLIWLYKRGELTNWYKLFSLAVRHFNTVPHQFYPTKAPCQTPLLNALCEERRVHQRVQEVQLL